MITCVPAVAFSPRRRAFAIALALLAGGVARAEEPAPAPATAPTSAPAASVDVAPLVTKAKKALGAKRWRDAKRAAENALQADAANVDAKAVLGLADKGLGDCKGARGPLDEAFVGKSAVPGVAGALAACLGDKTADKQKLAEARLAAAREAAGAGRAAEARGLYDAALGAALLTQPVEREVADDAGASAAAPASEASTSGEAQATPPSTPAAGTPAGDAPDTSAAFERARAEAAVEAEAARQAETRRQAPPAPAASAAAVVVAAPAAPPATPLAFQIGIRSAASAKDSAGGHHPDDAGLIFTWLTFAAPRSRGALVVDLESTRWRAAREDTMNRGATAFYGFGLDWAVPIVSNGTGVVLGAEAMGGVLQSSTDTSPVVNDGFVLQLMPHAGAEAVVEGIGTFVDLGWRFQLLTESSLGKATEGGFVAQGGLRFEMKEAERAPVGVDVGYTARFYAPNGSNIYTRYGGLPLTNSKGPLLGHELTLTTSAHLPRGLEHGVAVTYLGSDRASGPSLEIVGLGYLATWHAFTTRQRLNPYLGAQVGVVYIVCDDADTFSHTSGPGVVGTLRAGLDVNVTRRVVLRAGVATDAVKYQNDVANSSLGGYAVEAGAVIRL